MQSSTNRNRRSLLVYSNIQDTNIHKIQISRIQYTRYKIQSIQDQNTQQDQLSKIHGSERNPFKILISKVQRNKRVLIDDGCGMVLELETRGGLLTKERAIDAGGRH